MGWWYGPCFRGEPRITTFTLALLLAGSPEIDQGEEDELEGLSKCRAQDPSFSPAFSGNVKIRDQSVLSLWE